MLRVAFELWVHRSWRSVSHQWNFSPGSLYVQIPRKGWLVTSKFRAPTSGDCGFLYVILSGKSGYSMAEDTSPAIFVFFYLFSFHPLLSCCLSSVFYSLVTISLGWNTSSPGYNIFFVETHGPVLSWQKSSEGFLNTWVYNVSFCQVNFDKRHIGLVDGCIDHFWNRVVYNFFPLLGIVNEYVPISLNLEFGILGILQSFLQYVAAECNTINSLYVELWNVLGVILFYATIGICCCFLLLSEIGLNFVKYGLTVLGWIHSSSKVVTLNKKTFKHLSIINGFWPLALSA